MQATAINYSDAAAELQTKNDLYIEIDHPAATHVKYSVFYDLGGWNYFNGQRNRRGYYISVRVVTRQQRDGYITESYGMFDGTKYFISPAELKRNSAKARQDAAANITAELLQELTEHITNK